LVSPASALPSGNPGASYQLPKRTTIESFGKGRQVAAFFLFGLGV